MSVETIKNQYGPRRMPRRNTVKCLFAFKNVQNTMKRVVNNLPGACGMQMRTLAKWSVSPVGSKTVYPIQAVKVV